MPGIDALEVTAAAIIQDGKVLATRRARGPLAGYWELPGGKLENGETMRQCLARELAEELGVEARIGAQIGCSEHAYPERTVRLHAFACTIAQTKLSLVDHDACRWLAADELAALAWAPADIPLLPAVKQLLAT